jgi:alkanesulfonate monooxygenase SsuD/methylene tetrahydromethanopterin reductase-like flavin-dependent oxidoreductase (luciferase family)
VRFGLHSGQHQVSYGELRDLWRHAAAVGFDACYLFDHFVPLHSQTEGFLPEEAHSPGGSCLEGFAALGALAREIPGPNVGIMVAGVGYRSAGLIGHQTATLAQAAPGRLEIGIGAGWFEPDYHAYGYEFASAAARLDALEAVLEAMTAWARGDSSPGGARMLPMRPMPRLWVAGTGLKRILPLAARYADSWNAMYLTPSEFARRSEALDELCGERGRKPASLERSIALRAFCSRDSKRAHAALEGLAALRGRDPERVRARSLVGSPMECVSQLAAYADAGATHLAVMVHPPYDLDGLALLGGEVFRHF